MIIKVGSGFEHPHELVVWGDKVDYESRVRVAFYGHPWQKFFTAQLDEIDPSDIAERQGQEAELLSDLNRIESDIKMLQAQAQILIASLRIPETAPLSRSTVEKWLDPSPALKRKFPAIWPK